MLDSTSLSTEKTNMALQYIPELKADLYTQGSDIIDLDIAGNYFANFSLNNLKDLSDKSVLKLYRAHVRYANNQFEARMGLQKINFGQAKIIRPLQWFDSLDPFDPLNRTDGVKGFLSRYFFLDNANIWGWALYDNDLKGLETTKTRHSSPEYGARYQFPIPSGEYAFTFHTRSLESASPMQEYRYAMDGYWDAVVGLWFEGTIVDIRKDNALSSSSKYFTIGVDYTFDIGLGLYTLVEHYRGWFNGNTTSLTNLANATAISLNLPIGLIDSLNCIFVIADNQTIYRAGWRTTYDDFLIDLGIYNFAKDKGLQLIMSYNY
ncbi:hypothetical protein ACFLZV_05860 [Candidatus Margulisiibacteriota bacterium]